MRHVLAAVSLLVVPSQAVGKDARPPSPEQRASVEQALREQGYVRWSGIRADDGGWEIDSAWDSEGRRFELKLQPGNLRVIRKERED